MSGLAMEGILSAAICAAVLAASMLLRPRRPRHFVRLRCPVCQRERDVDAELVRDGEGPECSIDLVPMVPPVHEAPRG